MPMGEPPRYSFCQSAAGASRGTKPERSTASNACAAVAAATRAERVSARSVGALSQLVLVTASVVRTGVASAPFVAGSVDEVVDVLASPMPVVGAEATEPGPLVLVVESGRAAAWNEEPPQPAANTPRATTPAGHRRRRDEQ
jgi:hypothetical protein